MERTIIAFNLPDNGFDVQKMQHTRLCNAQRPGTSTSWDQYERCAVCCLWWQGHQDRCKTLVCLHCLMTSHAMNALSAHMHNHDAIMRKHACQLFHRSQILLSACQRDRMTATRKQRLPASVLAGGQRALMTPRTSYTLRCARVF